MTLLGHEREMLGLYVSDHPLLGLEHVLSQGTDCTIGQLLLDEERAHGSTLTVSGLITSVQRKITKRGDPWATITLEDLDGAIEVLLFPSAYTLASTLLVEDAIVRIKGQLSRDKDQPELRAQEVTAPDLTQGPTGPVVISLPSTRCTPPVVAQLRDVLGTHPGMTEVQLRLLTRSSTKVLRLDDNLRVTPSPALFADLKQLLGPGMPDGMSVSRPRSSASTGPARRLAVVVVAFLVAGAARRACCGSGCGTPPAGWPTRTTGTSSPPGPTSSFQAHRAVRADRLPARRAARRRGRLWRDGEMATVVTVLVAASLAGVVMYAVGSRARTARPAGLAAGESRLHPASRATSASRPPTSGVRRGTRPRWSPSRPGAMTGLVGMFLFGSRGWRGVRVGRLTATTSGPSRAASGHVQRGSRTVMTTTPGNPEYLDGSSPGGSAHAGDHAPAATTTASA